MTAPRLSFLFSLIQDKNWPGVHIWLNQQSKGYSCNRFSLAWPGPRGLIKGINGVHYLSDS